MVQARKTSRIHHGMKNIHNFLQTDLLLSIKRGKKEKWKYSFPSILDENNINLTRIILQSHDIMSHGNAISPDGQKIVFTSERDGNRNIYLMNTDGTDQTQLTLHAAHDYEPIFSPDGMAIVFTSERDGNREIYIS